MLRKFCTVSQNINKLKVIPISFRIENLPCNTDRKELFTFLKEKYLLPIKGIRSHTEKDNEKKPLKTTYLADCMFSDYFDSDKISLLKDKAIFNDVDIKVSLTPSSINLEKRLKSDKPIKITKEEIEELNKEIKDFAVPGSIKKTPLGSKKRLKNKNLAELLATPALQFEITNKTPIRIYRNLWLRNGYNEPCYYTLIKVIFKKAPKRSIKAAFGIKTWRGKTFDYIEEIPSVPKREWRYIRDPQTIALDPRQNPFFTPSEFGPFAEAEFEYKMAHCRPELPQFLPKREYRKMLNETGKRRTGTRRKKISKGEKKRLKKIWRVANKIRAIRRKEKKKKFLKWIKDNKKEEINPFGGYFSK